MIIRAIDRLFRHEAAGGILLLMSAVAALVVYNSPLAEWYDTTLNAYLDFTYAGAGIEKPLILWINDGLMAIFFFLVGLELKREFLEGKLKDPADVILPGIAAIGGMAVPAIIYAALNWSTPETLSGWAIPAATDIAFALGVLALLGDRIHPSLKVFLLTLAILDDIGAILIIAIFYTAEMKPEYLAYALIPMAAMLWLNLRGAHRVAPILMLGLVLWFLVLKSGVHATIAGVLLAFFIPLRSRHGSSPLHSIEHGLTPYVFFFIVPVFAFANAGLSLQGMSFASLLEPVPLGIAAGLFLGKQIGVFGASFLTVKLGLVKLPQGMTWPKLYGAALLAGIGFTMSLFIGGLSFSDVQHAADVRLGVLAGSLLSAVAGYLVLRLLTKPHEAEGKLSEPEAGVLNAGGKPAE
ncbi:Na+/H+ antiporter NhaA [uncultured Albimonas sp.]|uniref:Na+/H+ antiporter NhaA n=1 Tax=uncultured Albimonas sp. TaxID=1331701 RepID=UPI0030EEF9A4|tara:strand:- start:937 stop:2163 length:1227 start_codon:yes stop_codon:yes gene_type:complete